MRAVVCTQFGPPEKLVIEERPDPVPGKGQLLIDMKAAAVTFPDTLMLENKYQFKAPVPFIPGGEIAGVVSGLGEGVSGFKIGDRVVAGLGVVGGFAEKVVA
jgi:NADPH2:quinone reductase